jgi:hypothetical protein
MRGLELAVVSVRAVVEVLATVVEDLVDEQEVVPILPRIGVLEGDGLLDRRVDLEVFTVEVGQAVVLPLQQAIGHGLAAGQHRSREHQAGAHTFHSVAPKVGVPRLFF